MEIIVAKTAGFCYGVKRAVEGAQKDVEEKKELYCLGELVHNKQVIEKLEQKGLKFIDNIEDANGITIIRAHGVPQQVYDKVKEKQIELIDYTCPNVLKIHKIVEEYSKDGYYICLCGSKKHPENIGTISYCNTDSSIIENVEEIDETIQKINDLKMKKVLLTSQTTYSLEKFYQIEKKLQEALADDVELVIKNTICKATELRQKETEEIAKKVECMIVIGGKNSSNTKKLYQIAEQNCNCNFYIETAKELDLQQIGHFNKIGIVAGASTPKQNIEEVIEMLKNVEIRDEK